MDALAAYRAGEAALGQGRPAEALVAFDAAVAARPGFGEAHYGRGRCFEQLGRVAEAEAAFRKAVARAPKMAEAHQRLGLALIGLGRAGEGARALRRAAALAGRTPTGRMSEAYALNAEGKPGEAEAVLERLVAETPDHAAAHGFLGQLAAERGDGPRARVAFARVVALDSAAAGRWYDLVRVAPLSEAERPWLDRMIAVDGPHLHPIERALLLLAIGRACDDLGEPERAMLAWTASGELRARLRPYDDALVEKRLAWIAAGSPGMGAGSPPPPPPPSGPRPILIVGLPRSGTTLVESILARHPDVGAAQELPYWNRVGAEAQAGVADSPEVAADAYRRVLRAASDRANVTDKRPDNFWWLGPALAACPDAVVVHVRRDLADTAVSILQNFFQPRPDMPAAPDAIVAYVRAYERTMAHWRSVLPSARLVEIDYAELVGAPDREIVRLLDSVGLPFASACLTPERSERRINTASMWQARRAIGAGQVGRWRRYAPWLGALAALVPDSEKGAR